MKRANSPTSSSDRAPKKNWLSASLPAPRTLFSSAPIRDRDSLFIAHAVPCTSASAAHAFRAYVRQARIPTHLEDADHEIMCYRIISLKIGRTGEAESDFVVECEKDDDGENAAGAAMREIFIETATMDAVVVVSRWYGGVMLGPARFDHIKNCTRDVLAQLEHHLAMKELFSKLKLLDVEIESYLSTTRVGSKVATTERDYEHEVDMTEATARRLLMAREKRLQLLRNQAIARLAAEVEAEEEQVNVDEVDKEELVLSD